MPYSGLRPARLNQTITVPEQTFMVPDEAGVPTLRSDFGNDGGGLSNPQDWSNHIADGGLPTESSALIGGSAMLSRTFMPMYTLMPTVLRNIMGLPVSDTTVDSGTRRYLKFVDSERGAPSIETVTGYNGPDDDPIRLTGGKTQQISIDVARSDNGGTLSGSIDMEFNRYEEGSGPGIEVPTYAEYTSATSGGAGYGGGNATFTIRFPPNTTTGIFNFVGNGQSPNTANLLAADTAQQAAVKFTVNPTYAASVVKYANYFLVTFTTPANTAVSISRISGAGWSVVAGNVPPAADHPVIETPTAGLITAAPQYLEANHALLYLVDSQTELDAIDWTVRPDQYGGGGTTEHMVTSATGSTWQMTDLWKLHYTLNGKRYATDMVPGNRTTTASIRVPKDHRSGSDYRFIRDTEEDCQARGFYLVRRFICGAYEMRHTLYVGRNEAAGFEIENEIDIRTFNLERRRNIYGLPSQQFELWLPV